MVCNVCGFNNPDDSMFCSGCGAMISSPLSSESIETVAEAKLAEEVAQAVAEENTSADVEAVSQNFDQPVNQTEVNENTASAQPANAQPDFTMGAGNQYNQAPNYGAPAYNQPSFNQMPNYNQAPGYNQPMYQQPMYNNQAPMYNNQPGFNPPPMYGQAPAYQQPMYNQAPMYNGQPSFNQPIMNAQRPMYSTPPKSTYFPNIMGMLGAILFAVATFLPFVSSRVFVFSEDSSLVHTKDGKILLIAAFVTFLFAVLDLNILTFFCSCGLGFLWFYSLVSYGTDAVRDNWGVTKFGIGFYCMIAAIILVFIGGIVGMVMKSNRRARARARY